MKILIWRCPHCNNEVISKSTERHTLDECKCGKCFVDLEDGYMRHSGNPIHLKTEKEMTHKDLREILTWGTYGKRGLGHYKKVKIKDMETEHIENILKTQKHIKKTYIDRVLKDEIKFRNKKRKLNGERKT